MLPFNKWFRHNKLNHREKLIVIDRIKKGESKASVARDVSVPESTIRGWCKNEEKIRSLCEISHIRDRKTRKSSSDHHSHRQSPTSSSSSSPSPPVLPYHQPTNTTNPPNGWHQMKTVSSSDCSNVSMGAIDLTTNSSAERIPSYTSTISNSSAESVISTELHQRQMKKRSSPSITSSTPLKDTGRALANNNNNNNRCQQSIGSMPYSQINSYQRSSSLGPNDKNSLWQLHHFNHQAVIERIASSSSTSSISSLNFNFRLPDGLNIRPNPPIQPVRNSVSKTAVTSSMMEQPIVKPEVAPVDGRILNLSRNHHLLDDNNNNNNDKTTKNNNNNDVLVVDDGESDATTMDALEAIRCAEKFSQWFQTYSDPTLTTQDVLRFEQLLGKVRKLVVRRNNIGVTVQHSKSRRK